MRARDGQIALERHTQTARRANLSHSTYSDFQNIS
jgi:hypothetical protein